MASVPSKRSAPVDIAEQIAEARRRAAEVRARIAAANGGAAPSPPPSAQNGTTPISASQKLAEMKARVAAATAAAAAAKPATPPQRPPPTSQAAFSPPVPNDFSRMDTATGARGGLSVGIHPALLGDFQRKEEKKEHKGKHGRKVEEEKKPVENSNPYLSETAPSRPKRGPLYFNHNQHSRPAMQAANEMRRKLMLEGMKKRIQEAQSKAGLDDSAETKAFMVPEPPEVEFWDEGLQSGIEGNELITALIVHPILIEPPQDKFVSQKPMQLMLTKQELKKMRRIKRLEVHKEEQAKIRLGLVPTPAPKIKHSNVMRVYGEMAVQDPTAVEAMVNKQVNDRKNTHLQVNTERQLTKEEKLEKTKKNAEENAKLGLNLMVFKISLPKEQLLGKHRYLIDINAKQHHDITGFVIVAPNFSLCLVEAGDFSTRFYQKLMLARIKWQAIVEGGGTIQDPEAWKDVQDNTCVLLHKGQIRERRFKKWGGFRETETESMAREALARAKLENFWTQAKTLGGGTS